MKRILVLLLLMSSTSVFSENGKLSGTGDPAPQQRIDPSVIVVPPPVDPEAVRKPPANIDPEMVVSPEGKGAAVPKKRLRKKPSHAKTLPRKGSQ